VRLELELSDTELALRIGSHSSEALEVAVANVEAEARDLSPAMAARASAVIGLIAYNGAGMAYEITHLERATRSGYLTVETRPDVYQALGAAYMAEGRMEQAAACGKGCSLDSTTTRRATHTLRWPYASTPTSPARTRVSGLTEAAPQGRRQRIARRSLAERAQPS
jgi:hypothetical protein